MTTALWVVGSVGGYGIVGFLCGLVTMRLSVKSGEHRDSASIDALIAMGFWPLVSLGYGIYKAIMGLRRTFDRLTPLTPAERARKIRELEDEARSGRVLPRTELRRPRVELRRLEDPAYWDWD